MAIKNDVQKENQSLISLAVDCKFITRQQEQEILTQLIDKAHTDPDCSVVRIFRDEQILSQENIDVLFGIKKHLKLKMMDKRFGELAVANRFVNVKSVEKALELQNKLFDGSGQSKKIGDILVEDKAITLANKTAILLTQNRIKDEFLVQAMNDIATTEKERMTINMRFGAIAVKKGAVSIEQLNNALKIQKKETRSGHKKRHISEIFQDVFDFPQKEIIQILRVQKKIKQNRLALGKALSLYNTEVNTNKRLNELFEYTVSVDKLEAYLQTRKTYFEKIDIRRFHNWLKVIGIRFGLCNDKLIESFLNDSIAGSKLIIARGIAPTKPRDEFIEFFFDTQFFKNPENPEQGQPPFVKKGDIIAQITPHEYGKAGKDIFGHAIAPCEPEINFLGCGEGVIKKRFIYLADIDGIPALYQKRSLFVTPIIQNYETETIVGHVKIDTLRAYESRLINVAGNIEDEGLINCHELNITGNVFGKVNATGDIFVGGSIGREDENPEKPDYPTEINAYGNIVVKKNLCNAKIVSSKGFSGPKSDATSCKVYAFQNILLKNVHSTHQRPSILQIGKRYNFKVEALDCAIDAQTEILRKLQMQDEFDALTFKYQASLNAQDEYMEKRNTLIYMLKVCDNPDLKQIPNMEQKMQIFEPSSKEDFLLLPNQESASEYMDEIVARMKELNPEDQRLFLEEALTEISGMYATAVKATEKFVGEYEAESDIIMKKIEERRPEIDAKKIEVRDLMIKRDYLLMQEEKPFTRVEPMIRIKNILEKSSIIRGEKASMTVEDSIYGVKIKESKDPITNEYKIIIEGYYE